MKKNKNLIVIYLCILSIVLLITFKIQAFQITDNQTVDANKKWTINFTGTVGYDDITKQGIIITDSSGNKVNTTLELGSNNKSIIVDPPTDGYTSGESYTLTVKKQCHSSNGTHMKQDRTIHFNIKNTGGDIINNINYKIDINNKIGIQINITLDSNIDSSKYDVFLDNIKMKYDVKSNTFQIFRFELDDLYISNIRKHIVIKTKAIDIPVVPTIVKINDIDVNINKDSNYSLPNTIQATMSDGSIQNVNIIWDKVIDTSKTGIFIFYGKVKNYNDTNDDNPIVLTITIN